MRAYKMVPTMMVRAMATKHGDLKKATVFDEEIVSNMPKDVQKALNSVYPKEMRVAIRALKQYAEDLGEKDKAAQLKADELASQSYKLREKLLQESAAPWAFNYSNQSQEKATPHLFTVHYNEKGSLPKAIAPRIKAYFELKKAKKPNHKKIAKEVKAIDAEMCAALSRKDPVYWDTTGWWATGTSQKSVDLTQNKEYMNLIREKEKAEVERERIRKERRDFQDSCVSTGDMMSYGMSPFGWSPFGWM